jgi:hypothetical protein
MVCHTAEAAETMKKDEAKFKRDVMTSMRGGRVGEERYTYCLAKPPKKRSRSYGDDY